MLLRLLLLVLLPLTFAATVSGQDAVAERSYEVTRFALNYAGDNPRLPSIAELAALPVKLSEADGTLGPADGPGSARSIRMDETFASGTRFTESALRAVFSAIVLQLNHRGIYGVFVLPLRSEIDPQSKEDLRSADAHTLTLIVWASEISQVRTIGKGNRLPADRVILNPKHSRILSRSPLQAPKTTGEHGSLFEKAKLDDYLRRLNRQPGRSVEAAISAADEPGKVVLDYLITENKPWFVYAQVSNTGTEATAKLRERVGFTQDQLFNRDDIASIDYITSNLTKANAVFGSYSFPILFPDKLRVRGYGSWGDFNATVATVLDAQSQSSAIPPDEFSGGSWEGGFEVTASPWSIWRTAIDFTAGVAMDHFEVNNKTLKQKGTADLVTPYAAVRVERTTEIFTFTGSLGYETSLSSIDAQELVRLGRLDTNDSYDLIKLDLSGSTFLEPLFFGLSPKNPWNRSTLAHEVAVSFRSQYVLGDRRLIPQKEQAIGGFFSVRGYPDSVVAGDRTYTASAEYRYHIPRAFRPASEPETTTGAPARKEDATDTLFGRRFNYRPLRPYAQPDWDLVARAFVDVGYTEVNTGTQQRRPEDVNQSLCGAGVGLELQLFRNLNVRGDLGWALKGLKTGITSTTGYAAGPNDVEQGSMRAHLLATFIW